ncbi:MAG: hypothetical protein ACT4N2_08350 [Hyphomicrobium sp.]
MIEKLQSAIDKLAALDVQRQAYAASVIEDIVNAEPLDVPDDHLVGVLEGLAQCHRGERASDEQMRALWKKCGL